MEHDSKVPPMDQLSLWLDIMAVGCRLLARGDWRGGLKTLIAPVGYWRCVPFAVTKAQFDRLTAPVVLDIGSPKMLSLLLAKNPQAKIFATDLDDPTLVGRWEPSAKTLGLANYRAEFQDGRKLTYSDSTFDLVYSISVVEHIPDNGDMEALQEIARVLKPGGVAVIEVPYRRKGETIYQHYSSRGAPLDHPQFYERHYDREMLEERLIRGARGLSVEQVSILGERLAVDPLIATDRLPKVLRWPLLPLEPLMAGVNYWQRADDSQGRPLAALVVYRKPGATG